MGVGSPLSSEKKCAVCWMRGGVILNQTIVSDVARLHLDFILCDDSLHLCLTSDTHWEQILNLWPQYININIYIYVYIYAHRPLY